MQRLLIVDLTFCWDILLKDVAQTKRISLQGDSEPSAGDAAAAAAVVKCLICYFLKG